jgi:Spy/CpxP family protein refolding chaperone
MMRTLGRSVLTIGALVLLASPAWAQGRGGMGGGAAFLRAPNVQKDMKLTEDQVGKVQDVLQANREKHQDDYAALRDASPEERPAKMATLNKTVSEEIKKDLGLSEEQSKRFDQISLQTRGLGAFADPTVMAKLSLTDEQKTKIRELGEAARAAGGAFNKDASAEERAEAAKKRAETSKANMTKVQAMLTDAQKTSWKELTGTPIEIQLPPRPTN